MLIFSTVAMQWLSRQTTTDIRAMTKFFELMSQFQTAEKISEIDLDVLNQAEVTSFKRALFALCGMGAITYSIREKNCYLVNPCSSGDILQLEFVKSSDEFLNAHARGNELFIYILSININTNKNNIAQLREQKRYKSSDTDIFYKVCTYLNEKAETNYRHTSSAFIKHVNSRVSEGYCLEDFKKVIDTKVHSWKGTEFEKYLRPQTLFGNKFDAYLNEKSPELRAKVAESKAHDYFSSVMQEMMGAK